MSLSQEKLIDKLTKKVLSLTSKPNDLEKNCWMIVHEYCNGSMPFEYDIRGIDEDLYLEVLKSVRAQLEK
ncbi:MULTISPECIES: hypothetical protein [Prochlorococcus]|uniref:hypothetical protein n=1 Tax=Prochlorococcus TaxID=1218 RepID=UPI0005339656|nr:MULTISPECIES: hypothetical protein [Prochlorococcus]KGG12911.1 hypothetical protein EV05_0584 [Prochlorococcus sp. MIT 0601]